MKTLNKKNKYQKQRTIGGLIIAVGIIFIVIAGIVLKSGNDDASNVGVGILGVISFLFIAAGSIWYCIATSNSRKICDKCGRSMAGCEYEYQEKNRKVNGNNLHVNVQIIATCPHCGERKQFVKEFIVGQNSDHLQYQVDQFCRDHFGH